MNKLRSLREKAEITQVELAKRLDVRQSTVAMWESGANMPRADKLPELACVLGCSIDELYADATQTS